MDATRYVPPEMLAKIDAARATNTMRGERRTVTMLFADIQGSTTAAEGLDPEEWTEIINGAFERLIAAVYRYEGTLARLLGDAVLAFFGAPIAHEDDPVRAVRAGLEIVEAMESYKREIEARWGLSIGVRVGISTGLVVVGEVGSDLRVDYTALGDAVNVAARMEQTAEPGTVRLTARTWDLVADQFDAEEIGPVAVKGRSEPVVAYRAIAYRPHPEASRDRPLIGRNEPLERLVSLCRELRGGSGWVATIIGEAGIGKSRLLAEIRFRAEEQASAAHAYDTPGEVSWMAAFVESYDTSVPYSSVRDLLRRWWRIGDTDDPFGQITEAVGDLAVPDAVTYLAHVAGVDLPESQAAFLGALDAPVLHTRVRDTILAYLRSEAQRRPVVAVVEDIHWADPMSLGILEAVMDLTDRVPFGLMLSMRPHRGEPSWGVHEAAERHYPHRYHSFDLTALDADAARQLLDAMLGDLDVPEDLKNRILDRADGNPLFIEQMAASLGEGEMDLTSMPVPSSLSSLLTARLDRLDAEVRHIAQVASVVGADFNRETLSVLVPEDPALEQHLTELLRRSVITEGKGGAPGTLSFHHALLQEAAYSTMLLRTRRQLHGQLADHLIRSEPESVPEIAFHLMEAKETERAIPYLIEAGERASRAMALSDAIRIFTTAVDNAPIGTDPDLLVRAHDGLGLAYSLVPDLSRSEAAYQRLADYADESGRPSAKVTALNRLGIATATLSGDLATARRYLDDARDLAAEVGDESGLAQYHLNACMVAGLGGDLVGSVTHDVEATRLGERLEDEVLRVEGLTRLAVNSAWMMDFDRAEQAAREAREGASRAGDELNLAVLDMTESRLRLAEGDLVQAVTLLVESDKVLGKYADFYAPLAHALSGTLIYEQGGIEEALGRLHEARRILVERPLPFFDAVAAAALARVYATVGLVDEATENRRAALEALATPLGGFLGSTVRSELGQASALLGRIDEAAAEFEEGLAAHSASQYWERPRMLLGRARLAADAGDHGSAQALVEETEAFLAEMTVKTYDIHVARAKGDLLLAQGRYDAARTMLVGVARTAQAATWTMEALQAAHAAAVAAVHLGQGTAEVGLLDEIRDRVASGIVDPRLRTSFEATWTAPD